MSPARGTPYERITKALEEAGSTEHPGGKWNCPGPRHKNGNRKNPSLSIKETPERVLMFCHVGCTYAEVMDALKLPDTVGFTNERGVEYQYLRDGQHIKSVHRTPSKEFFQSGTPKEHLLYRHDDIVKAVSEGNVVFLVEGEQDADVLRYEGYVATTVDGGARNLENATDLDILYGADIIAVPDQDDAGQEWAETVHRLLVDNANTLEFRKPLVGKDVSDHIADGHPVRDLVPYEPVADPLKAIDLFELQNSMYREEWICPPLIARGRQVSLVAPAKIGKSLLMLEVAVAIAMGRPVFGQPTIQSHVLYLDYENDPYGDIKDRLFNKMRCRAADLAEHLHILSFPDIGPLNTPVGAERVMAAIRRYGATVVMIDTVSRAITGEENSNDTWLLLYRYLGVQLKRAEVASVRLDHTGKDLARGARGGSAKQGDVDAEWTLMRLGQDEFRLRCERNRMPVPKRSLNLSRLDNPLRHEIAEVVSGTLARVVPQLLDEMFNDGVINQWTEPKELLARLRSEGIEGSADTIQRYVRTWRDALS